jgi:hypothetical protein
MRKIEMTIAKKSAKAVPVSVVATITAQLKKG